MLIGAIAGVLVVFGVMFFDRIRADDPVGATSVHLLNGVFGTLCVGLFATPDRIARSGNAAQKAGLFYGGGSEQFYRSIDRRTALAARMWSSFRRSRLDCHQGDDREFASPKRKNARASTSANTATRPTHGFQFID